MPIKNQLFSNLRYLFAQASRASGLFLSLYSVWNHLLLQITGKSSSICSINKTVNCEAAIRSPYSELFGLPIGVFGAGFFAVLIWGAIPFNNKNNLLRLTPLSSLLLSIAGIAIGAALLYLSVVELKTICAICLGIYICLLFNLVDRLAPNRNRLALSSGKSRTTFQLLISAIAIIGFASFFALSLSSLKELILDQQKIDDASAPYSDLLETNSPASQRHLGTPRKSDLITSNPDLQITAFIDYNCPKCKNLWNLIAMLKSQLAVRISVDLRFYPLNQQCNPSVPGPINPLSCELVQAALCAAEKGKLAQYSDWAFSKQHRLNRSQIVSFLIESEPKDFDPDSCMNSLYTDQKISHDINTGIGLTLTGTPLIYLNGQRYIGPLRWSALRRAALFAIKKNEP